MTTTTKQDALELRQKAIEKPDWWIEKILDCKLTSQEKEMVGLVRDNPRVTIASCTASGKTFTAARIALWFLCNFHPSIVLTTSKTFRQVETEIWKEIWTGYRKARYPLGGRLLATKLEMEKDWFALGFSTDEAESALGQHSENILILIDEAPGIPDNVYKALETPLSTGFARLILLGNPLNPVGAYRQTFDGDEAHLYKQVHISAFDTPNFTEFGITLEDIKNDTWKDKIGVAQWQIEDGTWLEKLPAPYLINPLWVAQRYTSWGEKSLFFQVFVKGQFPEKGVNNLFNLPELEAAINRKVDDEGQMVSAMDVARYGDCETVYGTRRGNRLLKMETWSHQGMHYTTGRVARHLREDNIANIKIDAGGIGVDDCETLEHEGFVVDRIMSNAPAIDKERFLNRRAELYWLLSKRFTDENISILDDRMMISQLADLRYTYKQGKMAVESKEEMRARGSKSPDRADFLCLLFMPSEDMPSEKAVVWTW